MFKKLCVFLLMPTLLSSPVQTVDRSKLNFEVLDIQISNDNIIVNGWAVINDSQHFKDGSTHSHVLELKTSTETLEVVGELTNIDMTQQLEYRGLPTCSKNALNQSNCNYEFKKVGFKFTIPLTILKEDSDYEMFLKMNAKQVNRTYRIPLFYVQKHDTILKKGNMEYIILSDFDHIGFSVFKSTLVARTGPSPLSDQLSIGKSCSVAYGNGAFLRQSANFNNILDISLYNGLITYFKVQVQESGCVNQRQRVIESSNSKIYTYVPSTHVNYRGNPAILYVRSHKTAPNLFVESATLYQYETYNPLDYAHAQDETDGQIAVDLALQSNCSEIYIFGAIGERMDHVLANIGLLNMILEYGVKGYIIDENNLIFLMKESGEIEYKKDKRLSLTAFGDTVKGLSIIDAKYPLESYDLKFGDSRTVSNEFLDKNVTVKFSSGTLLVMITSDKK